MNELKPAVSVVRLLCIIKCASHIRNEFGQVDVWKPLSLQLESSGHSLVATPQNLVDVAWGGDRPDPPSNPVFPLPLAYTGKLRGYE